MTKASYAIRVTLLIVIIALIITIPQVIRVNNNPNISEGYRATRSIRLFSQSVNNQRDNAFTQVFTPSAAEDKNIPQSVLDKAANDLIASSPSSKSLMELPLEGKTYKSRSWPNGIAKFKRAAPPAAVMTYKPIIDKYKNNPKITKGIPIDTNLMLAIIACESGGNSNSVNRGAANGAWQIEITLKDEFLRCGQEIMGSTWTVADGRKDDRNDPEKSTIFALYRWARIYNVVPEAKDDIRLAVESYNKSEYTIRKLYRNTKKENIDWFKERYYTRYWSLKYPNPPPSERFNLNYEKGTLRYGNPVYTEQVARFYQYMGGKR